MAGRMSRAVVEQTGREYHIYLDGELVRALNKVMDEADAILKQEAHRTGQKVPKPWTGTEYLTVLIRNYLDNAVADTSTADEASE